MQVTIPHNREAEEALLGSVMIDPEQMRKLDLSSDDFYLQRNGIIFEACRKAYAAGSLDYITLTDTLKTDGKLAEVGGDNYLMGLVSASVSTYNVAGYAEIIKEQARRRRILRVAQKMTQAAYTSENLDKEISEAISDAYKAMQISNGATHWSEMIGQLYDQIDTMSREPRDVWGIATGLKGFDRITGGIHKKTSSFFTGEPGIGKSLFVMQLGEGMAAKDTGNQPGAVYEMEMTGLQTAMRSVSRYAKIKTRAMRTGRMSESDWPLFTHAIEVLSSYPIYMSDDSGWTTTTLRADLARLKDRAGISWFIVDYFDLLRDQHGKDETERTKFLSTQLRSICKDLDLAGLFIQGMNKAGISGSQNGKAALAGSVKLSYDADNIWALRAVDGSETEVLLKAEKLREGDDSGEFVNLVKLPGFPAFGEKAKF